MTSVFTFHITALFLPFRPESPVIARRHSEKAAEAPVEVRQVVEAAGSGDFRDGKVLLLKQDAGVIDPALVPVGDVRFPGHPPEESAKGSR